MNSIVGPRRKPVQSRAWMTSCAIQHAFVMLLVEQGYEKISMREIAGTAGVGLGTLYLYFPGKESIAAVTIRRCLRKQAAILAAAARAPGPRTVDEAIRAMVQAHVHGLLSQAEAWRALLSLERRISSPASYREIYREFVGLFHEAFAASSDWPAHLDPLRTAFNAFSMVDAIAGQALLVQPACPDAAEFMGDVECAVTGYVRAARAQAEPHATGPR